MGSGTTDKERLLLPLLILLIVSFWFSCRNWEIRDLTWMALLLQMKHNVNCYIETNCLVQLSCIKYFPPEVITVLLGRTGNSDVVAQWCSGNVSESVLFLCSLWRTVTHTFITSCWARRRRWGLGRQDNSADRSSLASCPMLGWRSKYKEIHNQLWNCVPWGLVAMRLSCAIWPFGYFPAFRFKVIWQWGQQIVLDIKDDLAPGFGRLVLLNSAD